MTCDDPCKDSIITLSRVMMLCLGCACILFSSLLLGAIVNPFFIFEQLRSFSFQNSSTKKSSNNQRSRTSPCFILNTYLRSNITFKSSKMADNSLPWDQRPGYLAAIATTVAPGGLTTYRKISQGMCLTSS